MARQKYRKASEIGEFVYCHHAWWLHHVRGLAPENQAVLEAGRVHHAQHGATVRGAALFRRVAIVAGILAAGLILLALFGG